MAQARTPSRTGDAGGARIGSGARVRGRIHGDGDLVVEGQVEGDLAIRGELTIAQGGSVASDSIEAQSVVVAGGLEGDVAATGTVRLVAGAQVREGAVEVVRHERTAPAAFLPARPEHEVVDDKLAAPLEKVGQ